MSNEIVKYENQMNNLKFRNFTAIEFDLLMTICSKMREKETDTIIFTFEQLQKLSKYDYHQGMEKFVKDLKSTYNKLIKLDFSYCPDEDRFIQFVLFTWYEINKSKKTIEVGVNPKFTWVLNNLTSKFTRFELDEFLGLKSKYSKDIYRLCKQYRATGVWRISVKEFRELLDIPESYSISMLEARVLQPAMQELSEICEYFEVRKIYSTSREFRRKPVVALQFNFEFSKKDNMPMKRIVIDSHLEIEKPIEMKPNYKRFAERTKEKAHNVANFEQREVEDVYDDLDAFENF